MKAWGSPAVHGAGMSCRAVLWLHGARLYLCLCDVLSDHNFISRVT